MTIKSQSATVENPVFPNIKVKLLGHDGNIFAILATVTKELEKNGVSESDQSQFANEVMTSNCYMTALNVCFRWVIIT